ncbi:MAG TPA: ScyD/ScyE family protein [Solirubrobacteraceae bacterium]|jgi:hypothetical protein|nr:ScyD/ScyE family protein [Solirubrobacteraceae bacterium]
MEVSAIRRAAIALAAAAVAVLLAVPAASSAATVTSLAKGLDNPRAVAFDADGHLFVSEAGHGGTICGGGGCAGLTSGISKIENGVAHPVVSGYFSAASPEGTAATGIQGISILNDWRIFAVEGETAAKAPPGLPPELAQAAAAQLGHLFEFTPHGKRTIADVGGFDFKWSGEHLSLSSEEPPGSAKKLQFPDANPYAVLATGDGEWVADAASNTIDWVSNSGKVKVVAFIPNPPVSDAVPTCIAKGSDGALYVGQLTGGGNGPGAASIWRVEPWDGDVSKWATGLTAVTGCGFDTDGDFYAVEFSELGFESFAPETGALVRVPPHSSKPITVASKLSFPNGFAARAHQIYTANWSIAPAAGSHGHTGEVVRITH